MQKITREILVRCGVELLENGTVDRVYGWRRGELGYDVTPALFTDAESLEKDFVWDSFCGANLSKYLIKETVKDGRVAVFLKPCDTYSLAELISEHRVDREKIYAVGVPCGGMLDVNLIRERAEGIDSVSDDGETVVVHTLFGDDVTGERREFLPDRCIHCQSKKHVVIDELIGEEGGETGVDRFDEVRQIESMSPEERFEFWQSELSRCIRCNACRDVCPACSCEKCVFDNPSSGVENKAASNSFEDKMFHIIRAFHVAGRCTDCGECSRVCPEHIPLYLLNRKFISDINGMYGEYRAGAEVGSRMPLVDYREDDIEPGDAVRRNGESEGGGANA